VIARLRSDGLFRDGLLVMTATLTANAFIFLYYVVMTRELGVVHYGELYALVSLSVLAVIPGTVLNTVIAKFVAEAHAHGDAGRVRALARFIGLGFLWLGGVYVVLGAVVAMPLANFFHVPAWAIFFTAVTSAGFAFSTAARAFVQGRQDFFGYSVATIIDGVSRVAFGALLVAAGFGVAGALGGLLVAGVLGTAYAVMRVAPAFATAARTPLHVDWRRVAMTTYGSAIATACVALLSYGDVAIVKHFFDAHSAGIYSAISLDGKMMFFLVSFAPAVLLPKVVDQLGRGQRTRGTLFGILGLVAVLSIVGLLAFTFEPRLIVDALNGGDKFAAATPYLFGYAGAMALLGVTNLLATYAIGIHRMAFAIPLLLVSLAGLTAIALYHPSIGAVVGLLVATNAAGLLAVAAAIALGGPTATSALEPALAPT
jgi:O-antigen/teichoic acid export membrane protein